MSTDKCRYFLLIFLVAFLQPTIAITVNDDFTQATDNNNWSAQYYACLTAGTVANNTSTNSKIPGCNYATPDSPGNGALRLTPASNNQHGAIVSNYTFPTNQGLKATFTTYTYGGDSGGNGKEGADGMAFFLMDGAVPTTLPDGTINLGSWGGSLAYSCSNANSPYVGLTGGYLGLGMDEYGNFLNGGSGNDNTASGIAVTGGNSFGNGGSQQSNRIGLRGAGNVSWWWLNNRYSTLYPTGSSGSDQQTMVQQTCATGLLQNGISGTKTYSTSALSWSSGSGGVLTVTATSPVKFAVGDTINIYSSDTSNPPIAGISIVGSRVVTAVSGNTFSFSYPSGSTAYSNMSNGLVTVNVMDYPAIPGGFMVLPGTQLIANESASTRATAWPIKYQLTITPVGKLSLNYSYNGGAYQSVLSNWDITTANGALPGSFRFGFTGSTGGSNNIHEISCFVAQPTVSSSSAGANTVQAGQVRTGTQVYLASYSPNGWNGSLMSRPLLNNSGVVSVGANADWDADCVLTGGLCASMGVDTSGVPITTIVVEPPASRVLLTWNGTAGIPMKAANLTSAQMAVLNSTDSNGAIRLNWLRGDRSSEASGPLRIRASVLGDIVDSSPTWVGPPTLGYPAIFTDALYSTAGGESSYQTYSTAMATRQNVVYAGANDGLLHGFRSGNFLADGITYDGTTNDGKEVLGFAPSSVFSNSKVVSLTDPLYGHNYFVDASPGYGDVFYNGKWHTWMVGGLGPGGAEIYALDITDPASVTSTLYGSVKFADTNASSIVVGDWTPASLNAAGCVNAAVNCGNNLGNTFGTPLIRRLHNGQWALIFGNGYGSANYHAGVFIGLINSTTGAVTFNWLDTGSGSSTNPNGIAYAASADLDGDHVADYIYAGDLRGNVWRFDVTSSNTADWGVSKYGQSAATPLFIAKDTSGSVQPITTKIAVTATFTGGAQRVIIGVGTGRAVPFTATTVTSYASGSQTVYGLWDWDMGDWNNGVTTTKSVAIPASSVKYASLAKITASPYRTFTRTDLFVNAIAVQNATTRTIAPTTVCWTSTTSCASGNTQYGWMFDLPDTSEQIIYNPIFSGGELFVNTVIPPVNSIGACTPALPTGWTMAFNMGSGGGATQNIFPDGSGSFVVPVGGSSIGGTKQNAVGTPYIVSVGSQQHIVNQTVTGAPVVSKINPQGGVTVKQLTWEQLR